MADAPALRFGIALQGDKTPSEYIALAQLIDRFAFDVVSVYNDLFFQPAIGPLLLMAPHVRTARIGPAALNPYTLHPIEIAGQIDFLDRVSGGRAYLGLARGAWLDQIGIKQTRPLATLREAMSVVRRRTAVPITLGTWGPKTARLAGEMADEVKVGGSANPSMAESLQPSIHEGEALAARPSGTVGLCVGAVTVVAEDRVEARLRARREVAMYAPVVAPLDPSLRDQEWLHRIVGRDRQTVADLIPDAALRKLAFAGTPADIVRQVEDLARAGVTRVEFGTPHGLSPDEGIRLLGERVLPSFATR